MFIPRLPLCVLCLLWGFRLSLVLAIALAFAPFGLLRPLGDCLPQNRLGLCSARLRSSGLLVRSLPARLGVVAGDPEVELQL